MTYYTNLERRSEGYVARVAQDLWPDLSVRRGISRLLASIIERANSGTNAWSVTLVKDQIRVNVGPVRVFMATRDYIWFAAKGAPLRGLPQWCQDVGGRSRMVYPRSVKIESRQYSIPPRRIAAIPAVIRVAALKFVDSAAARRKGKSLWQRSHSPGVIHFLNSFLRGSLPQAPANSATPPDEWFSDSVEGEESRRMRTHRKREQRLRNAKLANAIARDPHNRLHCEVPGCGFDFEAAYGNLGRAYAQVHHLRPLGESASPRVTQLSDLAVVCANCHVMIHLGGDCRPLKGLILRAK